MSVFDCINQLFVHGSVRLLHGVQHKDAGDVTWKHDRHKEQDLHSPFNLMLFVVHHYLPYGVGKNGLLHLGVAVKRLLRAAKYIR